MQSPHTLNDIIFHTSRRSLINSPSQAAKKERLDHVLVSRGLAASREQAHGFILAGLVKVDGIPIDKRGKLIEGSARIDLELPQTHYVSRGGTKLAAALDTFNISCQGIVAMDVGASTGGFTDCLLQRGALRVYAIDVGYGQLDWKIRTDSRVVVLERRNIRYLNREAIPEPIELAVIDVSFISLTVVIPTVLTFLDKNALIVALLKPQFEVGKGQVGRGGVVRNENQRILVKDRLLKFFQNLGLDLIGVIDSPVLGRKGNKELLIVLRKPL